MTWWVEAEFSILWKCVEVPAEEWGYPHPFAYRTVCLGTPSTELVLEIRSPVLSSQLELSHPPCKQPGHLSWTRTQVS